MSDSVTASEQLPDHMQDLYKRSCTDLHHDDNEHVARLLVEYQHIFSKNAEDLGQTSAVQS